MSIMAGILAGGQGLARGIDALGAQFADAREKEAFKQMLLNSGLVPQQQAAPMSLASLGQPNPQQGLSPMQAAPVAPVQTSAIPPINPKMSTPENQGIMDRFAKERQTAWGGPGLQNSNNATAFAPSPNFQQNSPGVGGSAPRGIRNNNPGNIEAGAFTQRIPGFMGSDGRFARFETPEAGIYAMDKLLQSYGNRGINTVAGVVNRWAPAAENGPATNNYIAAVARAAGVGPNDQIDLNDPNIRQRIIAAKVQFENGQNPYDAGVYQRAQAFAGQQPQQPQPLANVAPMQAPAPQQAPQQPMTLAQLAAPQQAPQISLETLAGLATNRYGAPIAQQIIARQLGRDPMQQQLQQVQLAQALKALQGDPTREGLQTELLRAQVSQAQRQAAGDTQSTQDMREYALARQQGFAGSFLDYQQAKSAAKQKPGLSATDQKTIFTEEDKLPALDNTIQTLQRAKELNTKTFVGRGAEWAGSIGTKWPGGSMVFERERAQNTVEFNNIMGMEAIKSMSELLKGATTDREMAEFQSKIADPSTPPEIRGRIIDRMLALAQRQKQIAEGRVNELRAKGGQPPIANKQAPQIQPPANQGAISAARDAIAKGAPREAVIQRLRENGIDPAGL